MLACKKLPVELYERYGRAISRGSPPAKKARGQTTIPVEDYKMSARDAAACDRLLAEAIYSSGVSFNFVSRNLSWERGTLI